MKTTLRPVQTVLPVWETSPMNDQASILVVDDEYDNLYLIHDMLVPHGYKVHLASSGQEAMDLAQGSSPDVILLDINMPGMDGFRVLEYLKSDGQTRFVPVVMVTGQGDVSHRIRALELGADDFLTKPVDCMELRARVRSLVKVKAYHDHMVDHQRELEREVEERTKALRHAKERLHEAHVNLKHASLTTIYHLSRAAEYKDEDTGEHIRRMSNYAAAIARQMNLGERVVEGILYAAPMHDIGKLGVPDRVLLKPGKLDREEWELMKQHTVIGASILEGGKTEFIRLASVIALTHHEKWDGSGYPRGLAGKKIPLAGRITAVADVFDALTSKRPYKEAMTFEKAMEIIKGESGSHFDPEVVEAFLSIEDIIVQIKEGSSASGLSVAEFQEDTRVPFPDFHPSPHQPFSPLLRVTTKS